MCTLAFGAKHLVFAVVYECVPHQSADVFFLLLLSLLLPLPLCIAVAVAAAVVLLVLPAFIKILQGH